MNDQPEKKNPFPEETHINAATFYEAVRREAWTLLHWNGLPAYEPARQDPGQYPMLSRRGLRSAISAACLECGFVPKYAAMLPHVGGNEPENPASALRTFSDLAVEVVYDPGAEVTSKEWHRNKPLRALIVASLKSLAGHLNGVFATEQAYDRAVASDPDATQREPYAIYLEDDLRIFKYVPTGDTPALLASPDHMAALVSGLSKVPSERLAVACGEVIRYMLATKKYPHDVSQLVAIAAKIYGDD